MSLRSNYSTQLINRPWKCHSARTINGVLKRRTCEDNQAETPLSVTENAASQEHFLIVQWVLVIFPVQSPYELVQFVVGWLADDFPWETHNRKMKQTFIQKQIVSSYFWFINSFEFSLLHVLTWHFRLQSTQSEKTDDAYKRKPASR